MPKDGAMSHESRERTGHATQLLRFAYTLIERPLPERLAEEAKRRLLDNIGCGLFGASQPWSQLMRAEIASDAAVGPCAVFGQPSSSAPPQAALANGTAIHGFELDDLIAAAIVHPGTVIVPAVLATAEAVQASGRALLAALVVGYEATARISLALGVEPSQRGFHKTPVVGARSLRPSRVPV
jgi:2-methylcitrate dehydratase PrpD